ncbi:MAG: HEAT repeat domain-containing protein, partial [Anaerolineae bacterium]|nr:HEAT repeat domain-containing protein [Anaerolineae bacterium]
AMDMIAFEQPEDVVQKTIEAEEAALDGKERAVRRKEREDIQARALEQIAHAQEEASAALAADSDVQTREIVDLHRLMPILVHFSDIVIDPETTTRLDPAEPLVQGIQQNLRRLTAFTVPRYVYNRITSGQALVLLDGLDDLPEDQQTIRLAWLERFMAAYPACTVIVTGPATGYHTLSELGLTPMFIRPWMPAQVERYADKWAALWPQAAGTRRAPASPPDDRTIDVVTRRSCGLSPMDITARIISAYMRNEEEVEQHDRWDWYTDLTTRRFKLREFETNEALADDALFAVANLAASMLDQGPLSEATLREQLEAFLAEGDNEGPKARKSYRLDPDRFIKLLTQDSGLLVRRFNNRYEFNHPLTAAFLASAILLDPDGERQFDRAAEDPRWRNALPFAVMHVPQDRINRAVVNKLSHQPDLLFLNLLELVDWMACTPPDSNWRGEVFKRLAAALIAPTQFPALREWAMAALVSTRDKNALHILRRATRSTETQIRALGCIGLGALRDSEAIRDLRPMLEDDEMDVQLAAALALGAIGTEQAVEVMHTGLYEGEENLRQAVAEGLAALPELGHTMLHDAATHPDMMVRRASVFGLARIGTPWALTDLYRRLLEDDQWYVRSAAEQVFARARPETKETAQPHPSLDSLEWVTDWLEEHQITLDEDQDMYQVLLHMLQDGEQAYRVASAHTLARTGYLPAASALYTILTDENDTVRSVSYAALAELETQYDIPLPAVI